MDSEVQIVFGEHVLKVSKQKLNQKSDYFRRLLSSDSTDKWIVITESEANCLQLIIRIGLELEPMDRLVDGLQTNEQLFKSIQIARNYGFTEIEMICSDQLCRRLQSIEKWIHFSHIIEYYKKALNHNLVHLIPNFLKIIDRNANKVMHILSMDFIITTFSAQLLIDILSRDSFGVNEMKIYFLVQKWTKINGYNDRLIKTIRISKIDKIYLKFGFYSNNPFDRKFLKYLLDLNNNCEKVSENLRICFEPNVLLSLNECESEELRDSDHLFALNATKAKRLKRITFVLPVDTHINRIQFKLNVHSNDESIAIVCYYCEVYVRNEGWIRVMDNTRTPCFATQFLYFDRLIASAIRLTGMTSNRKSNDFSLNFLNINNNLLNFGFFEETVRTQRNSIIANRDHLSKSDSICLVFFSKSNATFEVTDNVLKDKGIKSDIDFNSSEKFGFETVYWIRLTQPLFVNCIELQVHIDSEETAVFSVSYSNEFQAIDCISNWIPIEDQFECNESEKQICFESKQILSVRIRGHRRTLISKLPLRIKNFNIYFKN